MSKSLIHSPSDNIVNLNLQAERSAAKRVADILTAKAHLAGVEELKKATIKKKALLEAQIKSVVSTQLEEAKDAYQLLDEATKAINTIQNDFSSITTICDDSEIQIPKLDFIMIKRIESARSNILTTLQEVARLLKIPDTIDRILMMMETDINIHQVHAEVRALEKMRDQAFAKAGKNEEEMEILQKNFEAVATLSNNFERHLFEMAGQVVHYAQSEPAVVVKILQIIEREQSRDNLIREKLVKKGLDPDDPSNRTEFRGYRDKMFQAMRNSISEQFDLAFQSYENVPQIIGKSQQLIDDLTTVLDEVMPCFPPSYNIFEFFIKEYHIRFNTALMVISSNPENVKADEIINLVAWVKNDYEPQIVRLGCDPQPPLLDAIEPLYGRFREHIRALMESWVEQIVEQDCDKKPEVVDGLYVTLAPTLLFESVSVQISIARNTNDSKFFYGVMVECAAVLDIFRDTLTDMLEERWRDLHLEYIMAQINNSSKSCDQIEELTSGIIGMLEPPYNQLLTDLLEDEPTKFHEVAKRAMAVLADVIFSDLVEPLEKLFEKEWYDTNLIENVLATVQDYFHDIDGYIMESYFKKLAVESLDRVMQSYVMQLFGGRHSLDEETVHKLMDDESAIRKFFVRYVRQSIVDSKLQVLVDLRELLDADDPDMISLYFDSLLRNFPDVSIDLIQSLLSMRTNLKKEEVQLAIAGCKKILEQRPPVELTEPTIFGFLKAPTRFGTLFNQSKGK